MLIEWIVYGLLLLVLLMAVCWLSSRLDRYENLLPAVRGRLEQIDKRIVESDTSCRVRQIRDDAALDERFQQAADLLQKKIDDLQLLATKSCRLCSEETDRLQMAVAALEASVEQIQLDGKNARQNVAAAQDMARRALTGVTRLKGAIGNLASVADQLSDEPAMVVQPHTVPTPAFPWGTLDCRSLRTRQGEAVSADQLASATPD